MINLYELVETIYLIQEDCQTLSDFTKHKNVCGCTFFKLKCDAVQTEADTQHIVQTFELKRCH